MKEEKKKNLKSILGFLASIFFCSIVFVLMAVIVFMGEPTIVGRVNETQSGEPYTPEPPENTPIMFLWEEGGGEIFYLDFKNKKIEVIILPLKCDENAALVYGYTNFEAVKANYLLISGIVDRLGGIEIDLGNGELRYTGSQISSHLASNKEDFPLKRAILEKIFEKISLLGFSNKDFMFIINNSNTTLSFPDCYGFTGYMSEISDNLVIMN